MLMGYKRNKLFKVAEEDYNPDGNLKISYPQDLITSNLITSKPTCLTQEVLHHLSADLEERYFANLGAVLRIEQAFAGAE